MHKGRERPIECGRDIKRGFTFCVYGKGGEWSRRPGKYSRLYNVKESRPIHTDTMTINCHFPSEAHIVRTTLGSKAIRAIIDLSMHGVSKAKQIKLKRGGGTLLSTHAVVVMVRRE